MLNSKSIGNKIAAARKKANISQAELGKQVFISAQAVGKWERGESMPDITTINRLAEILGVDLNYFSESFQSKETEIISTDLTENKNDELVTKKLVNKVNWDMSEFILADCDFSGLKNLHEKFSASIMQKCLFVESDLSGLLLKGNIIEACDFTNSNFSKSIIQDSMMNKNSFKNCILKNTEFNMSFLNECDLSNVDLTNAAFKGSFLTKNRTENVTFKNTSFIETGFQEIIFEGTIADCTFENCAFHKVKFHNAILKNTFFKNNKKFRRVQFVNCKADKLTYAFLKNNLADLTGITLIH